MIFAVFLLLLFPSYVVLLIFPRQLQQKNKTFIKEIVHCRGEKEKCGMRRETFASLMSGGAHFAGAGEDTGGGKAPFAPLRENKEFKTDTPLRGYGLTAAFGRGIIHDHTTNYLQRRASIR